MSQPNQTKNQYPCPECVNQGWIGPYTIGGKRDKGSGRSWYPEPMGHWGPCWLCKGSGMVDERRRKPERRKGGDRRVR